MNQFKRRWFLLMAGALLTKSRRGFAQPSSRIWRVGYISSGAHLAYAEEFPKGMRTLGYEVGKNLVIEWRFANGNYDRLPALVADVVSRNVDVIIAAGTPVVQAVKRTATNVPVVMTTVGDPVASGFVASLARPGGNITGLSLDNADVSGKWLEMARAIAPRGSIAVLADPNQQTHQVYVKKIQSLTRQLGVSVSVAYAPTVKEIEEAFASMARGRAATVIVLPSGLFNLNGGRIAELALRYGINSIGSTRFYAERGFLLSYGQDYGAFTRHAATYVDKIFKGAKPSELPIEQPMILELVLNLATAEKLGVAVPKDLLARADKVIQ